jgi:hypothetical protein
VGQKSNWAIALFSAAVGGIAAAVIGAAALTTPKLDAWSAIWFVAILCVAFVMLLAATALVIGANQERPRLIFGEPIVELRAVNATQEGSSAPLRPEQVAGGTSASVTFGTYATTHIGPTHTTAWFAYVPVENRPERGGQDAANVRARLSFFDNNTGVTIAEMHGRWSDTSMDYGRDKILRAPEVPLPANGNPRLLDVAFKYTGDGQCYAMNDENVVYPMLRHRPLGEGAVRVRIEVRGSGCRSTADFELLSEGVGGHPRLIRR